jgi:hypothetical protein
MSMAAVFLDIERAFDTTWHLGLLHKLQEIKFSVSIIKLISSFLSQRGFRDSVEGEMCAPRYIQVGVPRGFFLSPTLYSLYINFTPQTPVCMRQPAKSYVFRKLQRGVSATETCCERWNIKMI